MSLINEALKRSEAERRARGMIGEDPSSKQSVSVKPVEDGNKPARHWAPAGLLAGLVIISCGGVYLGTKSIVAPYAMAQSNLTSDSATAVDSSEDRRQSTLASENHMTREVAQANLIVAETLQNVGYHDPADEAIKAEAFAAEKEPEVRDDPASVEASFAPDPTPQPTAAVQYRPCSDDYRLSAIVRGPDGATAIINGVFVQVGGKVGNATLVKLGRHTAELVVHGQKLTVQM